MNPIPPLEQILRESDSVRARREALRALAKLPAEQRWPVLIALSDPVWRVRNDAARLLLVWQRQDPTLLDQVRSRLAPLDRQPAAVVSVLEYLRFLLEESAPAPPRRSADPSSEQQPWRRASWWDDDPPVLRENLRRLTDAELERDLSLLPGLLGLQEGRPVHVFSQWIRRFVIDTVARLGRPPHLGALLRLLDEPRLPYVRDWVNRLLQRLDVPRRQETARWIACQPEDAGYHWARRHLEMLLAEGPFPSLVSPLSARPRRDAAAGEIVPRPEPTLIPAPVNPRPLGTTGLSVSPLGISGRYGLPAAGFHEAIAAGVNLFLWEPSYHSQTRCWRQLPASVKDRLVVLAGTFGSGARAIRQDAEQALEALRVERLGIFVLFWVRSPGRLDEESLEALDELRTSGKVQTVGLSTHLRDLAGDAIADGWPVLMLRHSLAHRGAEESLFPRAAASGTGIITFTSLCYGQLPVAPADCYRYSLSQPGVTACMSAPRDVQQLRHNLQVLAQPTLPPEVQETLRPAGEAVYRRHRGFVEWIRDAERQS
jgi:aryl-alcohol dehydrogenase-like predicted oxidoreductase